MNASKIAALSITVNLVLAVALIVVTRSKPATQPPAQPPGNIPEPVPPAETVSKPTAPMTVVEKFHWRQLESRDFRQYIANLRAIGCPEETIRDLVIAEVNHLYAPKLAALANQTRAFDFWKQGARIVSTPLLDQLRALQKERREVIRKLLGIDPDQRDQWTTLDFNGLVQLGQYSFLPLEKRDAVRDLLARYAAREKELRGENKGVFFVGENPSLRKLRDERRQELAQLLNPDELSEFERRDSATADRLRSKFTETDLTEDEYLGLFAARKAYDDLPAASRNRAARQELDQQYRALLGEDRYNALLRQTDPQWQSLARVAREFGLPQETLEAAYASQKQLHAGRGNQAREG